LMQVETCTDVSLPRYTRIKSLRGLHSHAMPVLTFTLLLSNLCWNS